MESFFDLQVLGHCCLDRCCGRDRANGRSPSTGCFHAVRFRDADVVLHLFGLGPGNETRLFGISQS